MENLRRNSPQRNKLRELLKDRRDHPDAQTLYLEMRRYFPCVSLGTVYRNLMLLAADHEIQSLNVGDGKIHFDPNIKPHAHFFCKKCCRVFDLEMQGNTTLLLTELLKGFSGKIEESSLYFKGVCSECLKKQ